MDEAAYARPIGGDPARRKREALQLVRGRNGKSISPICPDKQVAQGQRRLFKRRRLDGPRPVLD